MSSAGAAPNGNHLCLNLQNWHENIVKYDYCSINLRLSYLELIYIRVTYFVLVSFRNISFTVGPPWNYHISASFNLIGLRQSLTFPFGFGTSTELLQHI